MREYLAKLRTAMGVSQQAVADAMGISSQYYSLIENGKRQENMDITLILALAKVFDVSPQVIFDAEHALHQESGAAESDPRREEPDHDYHAT